MTSLAECVRTLHRRSSFAQPALAGLRALMSRLWDATPFGAFGSYGHEVGVPKPLPPDEPPFRPKTMEDLAKLLRAGDAFAINPRTRVGVILRREHITVEYH